MHLLAHCNEIIPTTCMSGRALQCGEAKCDQREEGRCCCASWHVTLDRMSFSSFLDSGCARCVQSSRHHSQQQEVTHNQGNQNSSITVRVWLVNLYSGINISYNNNKPCLPLWKRYRFRLHSWLETRPTAWMHSSVWSERNGEVCSGESRSNSCVSLLSCPCACLS